MRLVPVDTPMITYTNKRNNSAVPIPRSRARKPKSRLVVSDIDFESDSDEEEDFPAGVPWNANIGDARVGKMAIVEAIYGKAGNKRGISVMQVRLLFLNCHFNAILTACL
jgi:hypothetical protein